MSVSIRSGVNSFDGEVAGKTVAELRQMFRQPLAIADGSVAYIDGAQASESMTVADDSEVEFIKASGTKGA